MFGALRGRDFRLFWTGAFISNIGSWIQSIALSWLVYQVSNSAFALGAVNFAGSMPILLFSLIGGVYVDRIDRRRVLLITQTLALVFAMLLAAMTFANVAQISYILTIVLLTGIVMAVNSPAWQAFIVDIVDPNDLPTAIALNSTQFNLSRVAGPSIAGLLLATIGAAGCFFLNGLSFVAVLVALLVIRPRPIKRRAEEGGVWRRLKVGLDYAWYHPILNSLIVLTSVMAIFGFPYAVLMPVMAQAVLGLGADGYGALMAATGIGAIIGSLTAASWGRRFPRGRLMLTAQLAFAVSVVSFSMSRSFVVAAVSLIALGFFMIVYMTVANTAIQIMTPDALRGRVMSIWTLVSFGFTPIGSLIAGGIAQQWGAPLALGFGGAVCAFAALAIALLSPTFRALPAGNNPEIPPGPAMAQPEGADS